MNKKLTQRDHLIEWTRYELEKFLKWYKKHGKDIPKKENAVTIYLSNKI